MLVKPMAACALIVTALDVGCGSDGSSGGHDARRGGVAPTGDASVTPIGDASVTPGVGTDASEPVVTPPHVVTNCGALPAPGVWEEITPQGVVQDANHGLLTFVINPANDAEVTLGTLRNGIWKTTDCGATWANINTGMGKEIGSGMQGTIVIDPVDPNIIYSDARYGPEGIFKTIDGELQQSENLDDFPGSAVGSLADRHRYGSPHSVLVVDRWRRCLAEDLAVSAHVLLHDLSHFLNVIKMENA